MMSAPSPMILTPTPVTKLRFGLYKAPMPRRSSRPTVSLELYLQTRALAPGFILICACIARRPTPLHAFISLRRRHSMPLSFSVNAFSSNLLLGVELARGCYESACASASDAFNKSFKHPRALSSLTNPQMMLQAASNISLSLS